MRPLIEAVTVCVHYSDYLLEVVSCNRVHFTRWILVTTPDDEQTLDVAHKHNLEVVLTRDFHRDGEPFNKGRAIERGLAMLSHNDWVLHIDSDIALPVDYLESLEDADLDPECIYGADRLIVRGPKAWDQLQHEGFRARAWCCISNARDFTIGTRWCDNRYGYVPIGYHQLFHGGSAVHHGTRFRRYPECHSTAARADVKFASQWDRRQRVLIPETFVAHLEHAPQPCGVNWTGRKSPPFRGVMPNLASPLPRGS